jgi:hypothetical protein
VGVAVAGLGRDLLRCRFKPTGEAAGTSSGGGWMGGPGKSLGAGGMVGPESVKIKGGGGYKKFALHEGTQQHKGGCKVQRTQEQRGACEGSKKKVPVCEGLAGGGVKDLNQELRFVLDFFRAASSAAAGLG